MFRPIDTIRNPKGFTLMEVIVAMSVGIIGAMGGYALFANIQGTMAGNSAVTQAQQEARFIVERITRELRESNPDRVWPDPMPSGGSHYISFLTPRNEDGTFIVDGDGKPGWQRSILYRLEDSNCLYRYQLYASGASDPPEIVSKNIEQLRFNRVNKDMITISIRTFSDRSGVIGNVARSYADLYTMVKLRN
jgi:prepilin-type N-terminal cleavage/methylation domain-containing protein